MKRMAVITRKVDLLADEDFGMPLAVFSSHFVMTRDSGMHRIFSTGGNSYHRPNQGLPSLRYRLGLGIQRLGHIAALHGGREAQQGLDLVHSSLPSTGIIERGVGRRCTT